LKKSVMDRLTPIFIAASLFAAAGLAYAQGQIGATSTDDEAKGHALHGSANPGIPVEME
jgi:hypothetical protein